VGTLAGVVMPLFWARLYAACARRGRPGAPFVLGGALLILSRCSLHAAVVSHQKLYVVENQAPPTPHTPPAPPPLARPWPRPHCRRRPL
jgi:hypothetical protein